jgi:hypothetical protein
MRRGQIDVAHNSRSRTGLVGLTQRRGRKRVLRCLLAHTLDERSGDEEKSVLMMIRDKCAQEFHAYIDECEATGATNCISAAGTIAHFAFRSTHK